MHDVRSSGVVSTDYSEYGERRGGGEVCAGDICARGVVTGRIQMDPHHPSPKHPPHSPHLDGGEDGRAVGIYLVASERKFGKETWDFVYGWMRLRYMYNICCSEEGRERDA